MEERKKPRDEVVIRIGPGPDGLQVRVLESPRGQSPAVPFRPPFDDRALDRLDRRFAAAGEGWSGGRVLRNLRPIPRPEDDWARVAGGKLFEALLPGPLGKLWRESLLFVAEDADPRRRLRLRVRFDPVGPDAAAPPLDRLPWELLYDPARGELLALDDRLSVARYLEVDRPPSGGAVPGRLGVLVAGAAPRGPGAPDGLDLGAEREHLEGALGRRVALRVLPNATLERLRDALREEAVHVLHFMGHGDLDPATGEGVLMLEDEAGGLDPVPSGRLVEGLGSGLAGIRLVVLNACRTAASAGSAPWSGLAAALVGRGVGAVVAMTHPITDGAAVAFSRRFYACLAAGGDVEAAVHEGRRAIRARDRGSAEWAIPALFLRSSGGPLVAAAPPKRRWRRWAVGGGVVGAAALGVWLATGGPEPAWVGERSAAERSVPGVHELRSGETVDLPEIDAAVTVEIVDEAGQPMVRMEVSPDGRASVHEALLPGDEIAVESAGGLAIVEVLSADFAARTVTLRAFYRKR